MSGVAKAPVKYVIRRKCASNGALFTGQKRIDVRHLSSMASTGLREVMDFIDFLQEKRGLTAGSFIRYLKEKADPQISLAQVRQMLAPIKGNLSETISKQREERG
jgi:hypothetical protein